VRRVRGKENVADNCQRSGERQRSPLILKGKEWLLLERTLEKGNKLRRKKAFRDTRGNRSTNRRLGWKPRARAEEKRKKKENRGEGRYWQNSGTAWAREKRTLERNFDRISLLGGEFYMNQLRMGREITKGRRNCGSKGAQYNEGRHDAPLPESQY